MTQQGDEQRIGQPNDAPQNVRPGHRLSRYGWVLLLAVAYAAVFVAAYWRVQSATLTLQEGAKVSQRALHEQATLTGDDGKVSAIAFAQDSRTLAVATDSENAGAVTLWEVAAGKQLATAKPRQARVRDLAFSPLGDVLAASFDDGAIVLLDARTLRSQGSLPPDQDQSFITKVVFTADGKAFAAAYERRERRRVLIYNVETMKPITVLPTDRGVEDLVFAPDGQTLAAASYDGTVSLWDTATGAQRARLVGHKQGVTCVAFSHDGRTLYSGSEDSTIRRWEMPTGKRRGWLKVGGLPCGLILAESNRSMVVSLLRSGVEVYGAATGKLQAAFRGPDSMFRPFALSPDGRLLATSSSPEHTVKLWDLTER
jgi:WD40 repeat protein